jgi:mannobiose 2-epimerase
MKPTSFTVRSAAPLAALLVLGPATFAAPATMRLEAAGAVLSGPAVLTTHAAFSGRGYVSGWHKDSDRTTKNIAGVTAKIYVSQLHYSAPAGVETRALPRLPVGRCGSRKQPGQYEIAESDFVTQATRQTPATSGGDLLGYSQARLPFGANLEGPADAPPANAATYRRLAAEVESSLRNDVLAKWFPAAVDPSGGFHQNFSEDWKRGLGREKSIVFQSRLTWLSAQAAMRYPAESSQWTAYSNHGTEFLLSQMWDSKNGGFFWERAEDGRFQRDGEKHVYGVAFAIYALSANHHATKNPRALEGAQRAFRWLESHAHDALNGGYYEALARDNKLILKAPMGAQARDFIGTPYGFKSMNAHIHLLEAFSALYEQWPDPRLRRRLEEVLGVVRDKIAVEPGCLNLVLTPAWRAVPGHDSFGHDVETTFLLLEAAHALGRDKDARTQHVARRLLDHALEYGWDREHGGLYDEGTAFGPATNLQKVWWTQAESLNALLLAHDEFAPPASTSAPSAAAAAFPSYWSAFVQQWSFIANKVIDRRRGGWHPYLTREGAPTPGRAKSDRWTEAYHQGRALMHVGDRLKKLAERAAQ